MKHSNIFIKSSKFENKTNENNWKFINHYLFKYYSIKYALHLPF